MARTSKPRPVFVSLRTASQTHDISIFTLREKIADGSLRGFRFTDKPGAEFRVRVDDLDALFKPHLPESVVSATAARARQPPGMVVMRDLWAVWPEGETFMPTRQLVGKLNDPDYWGADSAYGKPLTEASAGQARVPGGQGDIVSARRSRTPRVSPGDP